MQIAVIGQGRLGRSLVASLRSAGAEVEALPGQGVATTPNVVLTVPDRALRAAAARQAPGATLLHCSGAHGLELLPPGPGRAVLHPLMSFPGPETAPARFREVPATLEGDAEGRKVGEAIAQLLGLELVQAPKDRTLYHAAAVLVGNGATLLLAEACEVLAKAGYQPEVTARLLLPLAVASLEQAVPDPRRALTGPAARGDLETLKAHHQALIRAGLLQTAALYQALAATALGPQAEPPSSEG